MIRKILLLIIICISLIIKAYSQTPSYYHYTTSDGLASLTVFKILQDRDGFIWAATQNGLCRFDGTHFITYGTKDGLNSNSIIGLANGMNGELYAGSYENGINVIKNGKIENYCNEINGGKFYTSELLFDSLGINEYKLYSGSPNFLINVIHKQNESYSSFQVKPTTNLLIKLLKRPNHKLLVSTSGGIHELVDNQLIKLDIAGLPDTSINCLINCNDSSYFVGSKGMIWKIKNNRVIKRYPVNPVNNESDVSYIFFDSRGNLWFSITHSGFFLIPEGTDQIIDVGSKMDLHKSVVNSYLEDKEGNIWFSTMGKGIYCLNHLYIKTYNENDGLISNSVLAIVKDESGKFLIGTFNGVDIFEDGHFTYIPNSANISMTQYIYNIKKIDNKYFVFGAFGAGKLVDVNYHDLTLYFSTGINLFKTHNGYYLYASFDNMIAITNKLSNLTNYNLTIFKHSLKTNRINEILEDSSQNIWLGTNQGLCKLNAEYENSFEVVNDSTWEKIFFPSNPVLSSKITFIFQDNQHRVWFAGHKGIANYNLLNDSIQTYETLSGYDLSSSTSITQDNKGRIWMGSMKGLLMLNGNSVKFLNRLTGLPSSEVLSLCYDNTKNVLCVGTSLGISFIDLKLFDNEVCPPLEVKLINIKADDSIYTTTNSLNFKPGLRDLQINYIAVNFSSPQSVKYSYKLNDNDWTETSHDFLNFILLKHGKYNLQIRAKSQNSEWGEPYTLNFKVLPQFIETIGFMLGAILLVIIVTIVLVRKRYQLKNLKITEELELEEKINELKHKALSAMMNPHFIFNSLNSLQYLINHHRNKEANDYLSMMARLIRKNLNTAGNGFILLSEEIERLKLYLGLEKMRFQDGFTYEIIINNQVNADFVLIPNMIIQPLVENALWHGIMNSGNKGLITISFSFEEIDINSMIFKSLVIKITDNGIGINVAKKNKKEGHISKGIQIIEERLSLLSTKMHLPKPIMFDDLSAQNNNFHGTEVIISLPPPLYKISGLE